MSVATYFDAFGVSLAQRDERPLLPLVLARLVDLEEILHEVLIVVPSHEDQIPLPQLAGVRVPRDRVERQLVLPLEIACYLEESLLRKIGVFFGSL